MPRPSTTSTPATKQQGDLTSRGARRREALLEAALRIIVRDGPGAVTLRSVVTEANAAHGSVVYYFGSREDLVREALTLVANKNIEALAGAWGELERHAGNPAKLAEMIARHSVRQMIEDPQMGITIIEFHLAAARYPELAPALREWGRAYARITHNTFEQLGSDNPEADSALLTNLISGLVLRQLALARPDFESSVLRPAVERLLRSIAVSKAV
ncbi:TetR family transcriptional regulator [Pseudomonas aeruginosa]|uniref:TetR/AcrR family transcriptional regulator n=1 Tax=Pseudomonas aeruginosa TaxID=287 RepID=UPI0018C252EF|nr:TetR family transcriptional regulator [Pseudomonas aeruginosa]QPP31168.1 TetR family transcriptional regulator [Pseudomonas aeruginosa]